MTHQTYPRHLMQIVVADDGSTENVADMLQRLSSTPFSTQEGTLYPLLSRMRRDGFVDYEWQESDAGPPRKYYRLTTKGQTQLAELDAHWSDINKTIDGLGT